jgi:hypothetical protein
MNRWKLAAASLSVLATASATAIAPAAHAASAPRPTAHAVPNIIPDAPPCSGSSCVGKSPYIEDYEGYSCVSGGPGGVGGVTTPAGAWAYNAVDGGQVDLRWSAFCQANWAYLTPSTYSAYPEDDFWAETADGHEEFGGGGEYTTMVDGTQKARACREVYGYGYYTYQCTGWY